MLLAAAAAAQSLPAPDKPLSLLELSDLALRNNATTRSAWADVRRSQAASVIAHAAYWPTLSAAFTAQRNQQIANEGNEVPAQTRYGPSVSVSYLLLDFGARSGTADQAAAQALATRLTLDQTLQDLLLTVESNYYYLIGAQAVDEASQRSLAEARANDDAAQVRHEAGVATAGDLYQAQAALAAATLAAQQAEGARLIADGDLAVAAGYPPDTSLKLVAWQPPENPVLPQLSVAALLQRAREARPELLAAKASEQAADAAIRAARSRNWPTLSFNGSAGRTRVDERGTTEQYNVSARVDLPLFAGFSVRGAIQQAQAARDAASADQEVLRRVVEQQVWTAFQNVQTARKNIDSARAQLRAAEQAAEAIRARYRGGLSTILEVLSTESTLAQARVTNIQAGVNWSLSLATLGHSAGGLHEMAEPAVPDTSETGE